MSFGNCYHLYQCGDHRQALFREDCDYQEFLDLYRKYLHPIADLYAYCLLPTHFHLLFRVKAKKKIEYVYHDEEMLGWQVRTFLAVYTRAVNHSSQRKGCLFCEGAVRKIPPAGELICKLVAYIHQNPQLYGVVTDFRYWPYSSCFAYLRQDRRSLISKDLLLNPEYRAKVLALQKNNGMTARDWENDVRIIRAGYR